jgi:hypothetical protein
MEWFTGEAFPRPPQARRHALVPHRAHQIITFADLRVLSLNLGHDTLVHLLLFDGQSLRADH